MTREPRFDLDGYLRRIGFEGPTDPSPTVLRRLHERHLDSIPFENIDVRLGRSISLGLEALQDKLVGRRRGGYCFEQNTLFAAALRALGFAVITWEARVRPPGATATLPRTHMVLGVDVDYRRWLADVGFGGDGPLLPVPLDGQDSEQSDGTYRVEAEGDDLCVLRRRWRDTWSDLYAFSLTPALPVDFTVANHFTSTHPSSIFVKTLTAQRSRPTTRHILRDGEYTVRCGEEETQRQISNDELPRLLADDFGLDLTNEEIRGLERAAAAGRRQRQVVDPG